MTALIETGAGLALGAAPSAAVSQLFGTGLDTPATSAISRVTGGALAALGVACWLARDDACSRAARGLIAAMLLYNLAAVVFLTYAGLSLRLIGIGLWPGVVLHVGMATWCLVCLRTKTT